MDFKVAGTKDGITSLQMDIKTQVLLLKLWKKLRQRRWKNSCFGRNEQSTRKV